MSGMEYWRRIWDQASNDLKLSKYGSFHSCRQDKTPGKALNVLSTYAGLSKNSIAKGHAMPNYSKAMRFFSGRRQDQYGPQVEEAIKNFYYTHGTYHLSDRYHTVEFILACVKHQIGDVCLNQSDNLSNIMSVICEKTEVDYDTLNANEIISRYNSTVYLSDQEITFNPDTRECQMQFSLQVTNDLSRAVQSRRIPINHQRNIISKALERYLNSFQYKSPLSDAYEKLDIQTESKTYTCPVNLCVFNQPVRLDGDLFDYSSLFNLPVAEDGTRENPLNRDCFYLDQVQPARDIKEELEAYIQQHTKNDHDVVQSLSI